MVFFLKKFNLPIGLHSSCNISPTAWGTFQKCFTKRDDWPDTTQCSNWHQVPSHPTLIRLDSSLHFPQLWWWIPSRMHIEAVEKRTSELLLYSWFLPASVCKSAVQQPKNGQTCSFFHCLHIDLLRVKIGGGWKARIAAALFAPPLLHLSRLFSLSGGENYILESLGLEYEALGREIRPKLNMLDLLMKKIPLQQHNSPS